MMISGRLLRCWNMYRCCMLLIDVVLVKFFLLVVMKCWNVFV